MAPGGIAPVSISPLAGFILLPPTSGLVLAVAGYAASHLRAGRAALAAGLGILWLTSLPIIADTLLRGLEVGLPNTLPAGAAAPGAIVVLGGDGTVIDNNGTPIGDIGALSLTRLRYGATIARAQNLPVLLTGGKLSRNTPPIAELMAASLQKDFGIKPEFVENASRDTWENASLSAPILRSHGILSVIVVTNAWHMRRALLAFHAAGIAAIPGNVPRDSWPDPASLTSFLPQSGAWVRSYYAIHEWVGCFWYAHRAN
jgi:uncharacterized SAM-binding protein YcdF (DUF218 family)